MNQSLNSTHELRQLNLYRAISAVTKLLNFNVSLNDIVRSITVLQILYHPYISLLMV